MNEVQKKVEYALAKINKYGLPMSYETIDALCNPVPNVHDVGCSYDDIVQYMHEKYGWPKELESYTKLSDALNDLGELTYEEQSDLYFFDQELLPHGIQTHDEKWYCFSCFHYDIEDQPEKAPLLYRLMELRANLLVHPQVKDAITHQVIALFEAIGDYPEDIICSKCDSEIWINEEEDNDE